MVSTERIGRDKKRTHRTQASEIERKIKFRTHAIGATHKTTTTNQPTNQLNKQTNKQTNSISMK